MYYIKSLVIRYYLKKSKFLNICALDKKYEYKELSWVFYKLGMYNAALSTQNQKKNFRTFFSKAISAANVGDRDQSLFYLDIIKRKYPQQQAKLILPLSNYFPEYAISLFENKSVPMSVMYYYLYFKLEGQKNTLKKYGKEIQKYANYNVDSSFFYSNVLITNNYEKLGILNKYFLNLGMRAIDLIDKDHYFSVKNLTCERFNLVNKKFPLVSVLVPAYNVQDRIRYCIESLVMQDYPNLEIIIIDDASTDKTSKVIRELENEYCQVKGVYLPINVGPYVAKSYAALISNGEYITTLDADDWAHPERITRQVAPLIVNKNLIATVSQLIRVDDYGEFYTKQLSPFIRFNPSSFMFRKEQVIEKTGLWDQVRIAADTEFIERVKIVFGQSSVFLIKLPLVIGAHRKNSLMTSIDTGNYIDRMSPVRLDYWESWRFWHIENIRLKQLLIMPKIKDYKPQFLSPKSIVVPDSSLQIINKFVL